MSTPLDYADITAGLADLNDWTFADDALHRTFSFDDFATAIAFITETAPDIDRNNHHPEWTNIYNTITVRLRTHDADDKVTAKDIDLARLLEKAYTAR